MRFIASMLFALCGTAILATPLAKPEALDIDLSISSGPRAAPNQARPAFSALPSVSSVSEVPRFDDLIPDDLEELWRDFANGEVPGVPSIAVSSEPAVPSPTISPPATRFFTPNVTVNGTSNSTSSSIPMANATVSLTTLTAARTSLELSTSATASPSPAASSFPSDIAEAILEDFNSPTKVKRDPAPVAEALNLKLPSLPAIPGMPTMPGAGGVGSSACNTTNQQTNQCSSGIPYCCSPDGNGGQNCMNGNVNCQQTVICCNNFNGFQFCMGDIDFNVPITINLNLGGGKGGKKKNE